MHAPFGAMSSRTMLNHLMWRCSCHRVLTPCPPSFSISKTPNGVSVQLPLFTRLGCPARVQLLDNVSSRCPAVAYLQNLFVQQMSSCWTVCPAVQYLHDLKVQHMSGCYLHDLVIQLLDSVSSRNPAVQYSPMPAVSVRWHVSHNAWLHANRFDVCCKSANVHARNLAGVCITCPMAVPSLLALC